MPLEEGLTPVGTSPQDGIVLLEPIEPFAAILSQSLQHWVQDLSKGQVWLNSFCGPSKKREGGDEKGKNNRLYLVSGY